MAASGKLVCVFAGPAEAVKKVLPYGKGVTGRANIEYLDKPQGTATLLKIIGNTVVINMVESLSEGHVLAENSGLGSQEFHRFIETMFPGPYEAYSNRMMAGDYTRDEPLFAVELARKDARHAMHIAKTHGGGRLKALEVADQHLEAVHKHMGSKGDLPGIYGAVRQDNGLKFEKK